MQPLEKWPFYVVQFIPLALAHSESKYCLYTNRISERYTVWKDHTINLKA